MERDHMNKLQDLSPRTRWQGWTIVEVARTMRSEWITKEYDYRDRVHYVDADTKKILGGIERTCDDFWGAWLTADGKPHIQLGEYTEKDAAIRAVQVHAAARKKERK